MADVIGVKETKEALLAIVILGAEIAKVAKDGLSFADLAVLFADYQNDPSMKAKLQAGVDGIGKVGDELKDLSFAEVIELASVIPEILAILKK